MAATGGHAAPPRCLGKTSLSRAERETDQNAGKKNNKPGHWYVLEMNVADSAAGPKPSSRTHLLLGVLGRTDNLQTALGLFQGCFFPEMAPKASVRRDRCISTRKKRGTA